MFVGQSSVSGANKTSCTPADGCLSAIHGQCKGAQVNAEQDYKKLSPQPILPLQAGCMLLNRPSGINNSVFRDQGLVQVNSIVLDGSVSKEERVNHWTSEHRRIIFATPQAFKNDVFKGNTTRYTSVGGCGKQTSPPSKALETPLA